MHDRIAKKASGQMECEKKIALGIGMQALTRGNWDRGTGSVIGVRSWHTGKLLSAVSQYSQRTERAEMRTKKPVVSRRRRDIRGRRESRGAHDGSLRRQGNVYGDRSREKRNSLDWKLFVFARVRAVESGSYRQRSYWLTALSGSINDRGKDPPGS